MATITTRSGKGSPLTNTEVDNNFTNLNTDKQEVLAEGSFADGDKTKLDGIESGATADQSASEIKTAYESNTNTNAYTDAEKTKLSGIEAGATADQSASEILTAIKTVDGAGSGLDADTLDGNQATAFATSAQGALADSAVQPSDNVSDLTNDAGYITGNQTITLSGDASGSGTTSITVTVADDSHNHVISNVDGLQTALDGKQPLSTVLTNTTASFTTADETKLDGIESGATADQTASEILTAIKTVDGAASGLDADLLDGQQGSYYASTSYVDSAVAGVVDSAPATLDTLNELAAALGDDPNFATSVSTSIGEKLAKASNLSDLTNASTARTNLGLGSLATKSAVGAAEITDNTVGAAELNVTGNGTTSQYLRSDGDGSFSWVTPPDTNTTYSAGSGLSLSGTTFSHTDTSSVANVNNSGATVIQDLTFDTYGHVTGTASKTMTLADLGYTGETNATADQTASEILTAIKTVDGSGSGLDADLLDGQHASAFAATSHTHSYMPISAGSLSSSDDLNSLSGGYGWYKWSSSSPANAPTSYGILLHQTDGSQQQQLVQTYGGASNKVRLFGRRKTSGSWDTSWTEYWSDKNDGSGSGLDADLLDGQQGSYYYPASNPNGYTTNVGDITGVTAGTNLTGGGTSGTVTLNVSSTPSFTDVYVDDQILSTGDTNTYMQFHAADQWRVVTGGSERFEVNNSACTVTGNLAVTGTVDGRDVAADGTKLDGIEAGATADQTASEILTAIKTVDGSGSGLDADTLDGIQGSNFLRSDTSDTMSGNLTVSAGDLNVGGNAASNPFSKIRLGASQYGACDIVPTDDSFHKVGMAFYTDGSADNTINPTERMRITAGGKVGIGTGAPYATLEVVAQDSFGATKFFGDNDVSRVYTAHGLSGQGSKGAILFYHQNNFTGAIVANNNGTTSYNTSSDYRLKTDVQPMTGAIDRLKALKPVNFEWIINGSRTDGFLAHELAEVIPEAVTGTKDAVTAYGNVADAEGTVIQEDVTEPDTLEEGQVWTKVEDKPDYQGIDQSKIAPLLVAALQEALTKIEDLETRLAALEAE